MLGINGVVKVKSEENVIKKYNVLEEKMKWIFDCK